MTMSDEQTQTPEEQKDVQGVENVENVQIEETPAEESPAEEAIQEEIPAEEEKEEPTHKAKLINFSDLRTGQTVRIHERIKDVSPKGEERERIQIFEGIILGFGGKGVSRTVTVRKVTKGYGVEKIYPINSPVVAKIELVKIAKVRQSKLGYLSNLRRRFKRKLKETYIDQK